MNYKVPLLIYGETRSSNTAVRPAGRGTRSSTGSGWRSSEGLLGNRIDDMLGVEGITESDLIPYRYPTDEELADVGVSAIFLGYYLRWDAREQLEEVMESGFQRQRLRFRLRRRRPTRRARTRTTRTSTASSSGSTTT